MPNPPERSIDAITPTSISSGERWPINPIRVQGNLRVKLLGLPLARIDLDLTIAAIDRFVDFVRTHVTTRSDHDLESLTRQELYELARDADIAGRSRMDRDELIDALQSSG